MGDALTYSMRRIKTLRLYTKLSRYEFTSCWPNLTGSDRTQLSVIAAGLLYRRASSRRTATVASILLPVEESIVLRSRFLLLDMSHSG